MVSEASEQFFTVPWIVTSAPGHATSGSRAAVSSTHGRPLQRTDTEVFSSSTPQLFAACAATANVTLLPAVQAPIETSLWNALDWPGSSEPAKTCWPSIVTV